MSGPASPIDVDSMAQVSSAAGAGEDKDVMFDELWEEASGDTSVPPVFLLEDTPPSTPKRMESDIDGSGSLVAGAKQQQDNHATAADAPFAIPTVPWHRQLITLLLHKNLPLLSRKPVHVFIMLASSVASVLLAWPAGKDVPDDEATYPDLNECGAIPPDYFDGKDYDESDSVQLSLNENWRIGLPVAVLSLGPMLTAICAYLIVHEEIQVHLLGILRGLGMVDSVYWASWYIPMAAICLVNSLLAAATAKTLPVHIFEATYFGGIFASFFFVQLALIGASFFLAAVSGTARRGSVWLILVMVIAVWIPFLIMANQGSTISVDAITVTTSTPPTPMGLFWVNRQTLYSQTTLYSGEKETSNTTYCDNPIMSDEEGSNFKTEAERSSVTPDEFFVGCYVSAGWGSTIWAPTSKTKFGIAVLFFFPYVHFNTIWGNFAGFTGMKGTEFTASHSKMNSGELARESLPVPPSESTANGTSLFPQGSMLQEEQVSPTECETVSESGQFCEKPKNNCPAADLPGFNFCFSSVEDPSTQCRKAPSSPAEGFSVLAMEGFLFALSVMYMIMAAYWGIVVIGGPGSYPFYFFLMPSYWFGIKLQPVASNLGDEERGSAVHHGSAAPGTAAVKVDSVEKSYGSVRAIKGVSLQMARGEVTALLGHNGAGKTTLSNVLTCEVLPTGGDITVFGHSVKNNPYAIRRLVGVCKQDNYLWPTLTAKEHLSLFAGLRGVDPKDQPEIVQKWLASVDLETVQFQQSSQFSGGMKRRLSLALATIGGRPLIVLDEPTTGMDPVSRRFVWRHIDEIKQNRVVLLTTHAMEEADLLSDMVAIMRRGELAAWGSPLQLKSEYGSALQFSVLVEKQDSTTAAAAIRSHFASSSSFVKIEPSEAGNITVNILKIQQYAGEQGVRVEVLSSFVTWLDDPKSKVSEYGFSNSSLEEVFLKVTEGDAEEEANETNGRSAEDAEMEAMATSSANGTSSLNAFTPNLTVLRQVQALVWHNCIRSWTSGINRRKSGSSGSTVFYRCLANWLIYGVFFIVNTCMAIWFASVGDKVPPLTMPVLFISFMLLSICSIIYGDRAEEQFYLMRTQGLLSNSYLVGTGLYAFIVAFVYSVLMLSAQYATPMFREPTLCTPNYEEGEFCEISYGDPPVITEGELYPVSIFEGQDVLLYAFPSPGGYLWVFGAAAMFALTVPGATLASSYLPGQKFALVCIASISLMASVTPLILYYINPFLKTDFFKTEAEECITNLVPVAACDKQYTIDEVNEDFLNCIGLGMNANRQASLCTPTYVGLLPQYALFQELSLALFAKIVFVSDPPEYAEKVLIPRIQGGDCSGSSCALPFSKKLYWQYIGFEMVGAIVLIIIGVALAYIFAFPAPWVLHVKHRLTHAIKFVRCQLRKMHNHQSGDEGEKVELDEVAEERAAVKELVQPLLTTSVPGAVQKGSDEDEGPKLGDMTVIQRELAPPILMHKLRKVYPSLGGVPPKVALMGLDLHVPRGQVLGLLGKNGAGKTTALKILAGAHDATSGVGLVAGYDCGSERIKVFERLGNCPQFDVIWPKVTVKEHLVFFAALKGLPRKEVHSASLKVATAVGLGANAVYNRQAGSLSGGMRRRLSIAIALIGAPSVFVLDEPTTGLDPSTRNSIWSLLNSFATDSRAIVITTHMMIEADTLCNRIAIVAKGELVVVGTQQHLKDRFGSGYLLQLNLVKSTPENQEEAMTFVRSTLHKDATLGTKQAKTLHITLPRDLDLKRAFDALYSPGTRPACINQFLLSQSSLEDVFLVLGD